MTDEKPDQSGGDTFATDLFGAPVDQMRDRWGRPSFAKTKENQILVATLKAAGWSQHRIARYLDCDEKTLRKHFSRELEAGADLIEGQALQVRVSKMRQGNLRAVDKVLDMIAAKAKPAVPERKAAEADDEAPAPEAKLGKKERQKEAAKRPGAGWGVLLN